MTNIAHNVIRSIDKPDEVDLFGNNVSNLIGFNLTNDGESTTQQSHLSEFILPEDTSLHSKKNVVWTGEKECKENVQEQIRKKYPNLNFVELTERVQDKLHIRKICGGIRFYNGTYYELLSRKRFMKEAISLLTPQEKRVIKSLRPLREAFTYLGLEYLEPENRAFLKEAEYYISFKNGDYHIPSGMLVGHSSDHYTIRCINAEYMGGQDETPYFDYFIESMTEGDEESQRLIYEMIAFFMITCGPQRCFFYLGCQPGCGKSLLGAFLRNLLGAENCMSVEADVIGRRFSLAKLESRYNILSLESSGSLSKTSRTKIKELTGNDSISVEGKGRDTRELINISKLFIASNDPLELESDDPAFWERVKYIPTTGVISDDKKDPYYLDFIMSEIDYIASKAARVATELMANAYRFTVPLKANYVIEQWRYGSTHCDKVQTFISEHIQLTDDRMDFCSTDMLYHSFNTLGYNEQYISKTQFSMKLALQMNMLGRAKERVNNFNGYRKVSLV